jgi:hypothetical protein
MNLRSEMKNFEEHFGTYARSDLGTTFRCEKKITDHFAPYCYELSTAAINNIRVLAAC